MGSFGNSIEENQGLTVIYFGKLELVGILNIIRLRYDFQPYRWTSWASRISEKMKKANEGREGQTKARV